MKDKILKILDYLPEVEPKSYFEQRFWKRIQELERTPQIPFFSKEGIKEELNKLWDKLIYIPFPATVVTTIFIGLFLGSVLSSFLHTKNANETYPELNIFSDFPQNSIGKIYFSIGGDKK
ncbi:MAG: hypothetical protein AABY84_09520 [Candidatus Firestonebacteria bacterium]